MSAAWLLATARSRRGFSERLNQSRIEIASGPRLPTEKRDAEASKMLASDFTNCDLGE
ncbi:hypothetical protein [Paraburkholderia tropica]|uniref:hypothetical protein n=1 Tax=Paraburkholderia tropica TaxID=92647 RepID=UPI0012EA340D|nr:hypothetical protein [Paraburkholderia tropica]